MKFKIVMIVEDKFTESDYAYNKEKLEKDLKGEIYDMELGIETFEIEEMR
jgi:hypothetical protein